MAASFVADNILCLAASSGHNIPCSPYTAKEVGHIVESLLDQHTSARAFLAVDTAQGVGPCYLLRSFQMVAFDALRLDSASIRSVEISQYQELLIERQMSKPFEKALVC